MASLAIQLGVVGRTPFPGASWYPTTAGRDRAGVRSVNGWALWISPTRKDRAGQRGAAQAEHPGLVDAERLDLRPSVPSTAVCRTEVRETVAEHLTAPNGTA